MLNLKDEEVLAKQTLKSTVGPEEQVRRWVKASSCPRVDGQARQLDGARPPPT